MTVNSRAGMTRSQRLPPAEDLAKLALFRSVNVEELPPFLHDCEIRSVPSGARNTARRSVFTGAVADRDEELVALRGARSQVKPWRS